MQIARLVIVFIVLAVIGLILFQAQRSKGFARNAKGTNMENNFVEPIHTDFDLAFTDGHKFTGQDDAIVPVSVIKVGDLKISSGKIMACDPGIISPSDTPTYTFNRKVPNGLHPVFISFATVGPKHNRVAAVKVQFNTQKVVRWEMALKADEQMNELKSDERFGYGVDCGTGCFVDPVTLSALKDSDYDESTTEKLWHDMDEHGGEYGSLTFAQGNLIAVHSGWGDGHYPSYFGLDTTGNPVCLVTDFDVLVTSIDTEIVLNDLPSLIGKKVDSPDLKAADTEILVKAVPGKPDAVLFEISGDRASYVDIDHKKSKGIKQSTLTYEQDARKLEVEFDGKSDQARLTFTFAKGMRAFQ